MSVIIPLYNKASYIQETLNTVFMQSYLNWECLIIDDGSTDNSVDIVNAFIVSHPGNWRVYQQNNLGQAAARNFGIKKARGKYVAFLDADDLWAVKKLSIQVNSLELSSKGCVLGSYIIFQNNRQVYLVSHRTVDTLIRGWASFCGFGGGFESIGLVKRSLLNEIIFDQELSTSSGLDFCIRLWKAGELLLVTDVLMFYRRSEGQWHRNFERLVHDILVIYRLHFPLQQSRFERYLRAYIKLNSLSSASKLTFAVKSLMQFDLAPVKLAFSFTQRKVVAWIRLQKLRMLDSESLLVGMK